VAIIPPIPPNPTVIAVWTELGFFLNLLQILKKRKQTHRLLCVTTLFEAYGYRRVNKGEKKAISHSYVGEHSGNGGSVACIGQKSSYTISQCCSSVINFHVILPKYLTSCFSANAVRQRPTRHTRTPITIKPDRCLCLSDKYATTIVTTI